MSKWSLFAALIALAALLWQWPHRPPKVELLPFAHTPPAWDGSYPQLLISLQTSSPVRFASAMSMLQLTIKHEKPVNEFDVDLHTGRFILRQTNLFVPDVIPLALTRTYVVWDYQSRAFGVGGNSSL